jgi:hypothetical protein
MVQNPPAVVGNHDGRCTGDGAPDFIHETGFSVIGSLGGKGIPFIKPWEDRELYSKLEKAEKTGASAVGMDLEAAGLITLRLMGRPVSPKSAAKLQEIIARTPMKFILKGIMTPDEATLAVDAGAAAIVVSNHGGRVLDHTPGVAEALPRVSRAVRGREGIDVCPKGASGSDAAHSRDLAGTHPSIADRADPAVSLHGFPCPFTDLFHTGHAPFDPS